jgi:glycosyltransferase involved in cell wall biosynthesis
MTPVNATKPRRILVLNERDLENPRAGGAEVHVFEIFRRLAARGHDVRLLAASFRGAARETVLDGVRVRRLVDRHLYYAAVHGAARREHARQAFDVVVDVLNKLPFFSPWFEQPPACAIVHHLFGRTAFDQVSFPIALATWLSEKLIPRAYGRTPMLAISPSTRDDLLMRGIPAPHVAVVPPGLDHGAYHPDEARTDRQPLVLWIGRLEHYKRVDVMIDAMAAIRQRVPDAWLLIVGTGGARSDLERRVESLGLRGVVEFAGYLDHDAKVSALRRAAVLVATSAKEGWGLTIQEGNACGTPSVASDVPGLRDAIRHEETGLLVPYGDPAALAAAVVRVLTDPGLRSRLSAGGLAWARSFDWDVVADETERLIERAIAGRAQRAEG